MKSTGIVRKIDEIGRIVIPKNLREAMNLSIGTDIEIFTDKNRIVLDRYHPANSCRECGHVDRPLYGKTGICKNCIDKLSKAE